MYDTIIRGGSVIDGSGGAAITADIAIRDGRIAAVGSNIAEEAKQVIDAGGLMVCPGFVDAHTHYDAQLMWDPYASPSNLHGVTTIIGGNCGFTIAPLGDDDDADYIRRMMAVVEGMPLEALEQGIDWRWRTFADWLACLEGNLAVNAAFLVGHSAIRRTVMGKSACGEIASPEQQRAMTELLAESIRAGAIGFSTSRSFSHEDGDGGPVPSRFASEEEVLALCEEVAKHEGTTLEFISAGCLRGLNNEEVALMTKMSLTAKRPLNWNVFTIDSKERALYDNQIAALDKAAAQGARVVALTMPILVGMTISFLHRSPIYQLPGWNPVMTLPLAEKMQALRDPEIRAKLEAGSRSEEAGVFARLADWGNVRIGETYSEANRGLTGRLVNEIAAARGKSDFDTLLDIVLEDELKTILWPSPTDDDAESWAMRVAAWDHPYIMLGGSDAGAHLDGMCGAPYTTTFLGDCLRGRKLVSVERAVQMMTDVPAKLFGLKDRGRIEVGAHADIVIFDPDTVGCGEVKMVNDLPGESSRLFAEAIGVHRVMVNGSVIIEEGKPTDIMPGKVLRSGSDTKTATLN